MEFYKIKHYSMHKWDQFKFKIILHHCRHEHKCIMLEYVGRKITYFEKKEKKNGN
jgi:hypothetical protein